MKYEQFTIENYRAIKGPLKINLRSRSLIPLIGLNECGKTTILQAIFSFDSVNDLEYEKRHINEVGNLYQTKSGTPVISALINAPKSTWIENAQTHSTKVISHLNQTVATQKTLNTPASLLVAQKIQEEINYSLKWLQDFQNLVQSGKGDITISRNLYTKDYSIQGLAFSQFKTSDKYCRHIISYMPYILYNDDFQDRPPSIIDITEEEPSTWQSVFAKLFDETNTGHSLLDAAKVEDQRRRDSIVSDVQAVLNDTLSKAWKSFHLDRNKKVKIRLELTPFSEAGNAQLRVKIVENIGENERFFDVVDRSKGFLWFYNFVMKTEFNPKSISGRKDTIYLLDEPGSYLHSAAQSKLCEKLKAISKNNGKVIYCTHSPHLLHPECIPINDIHIVTKSNKKEISIERLPEYKTSSERVVALQPIYEALQINGQQFINTEKPMLAVEGIYDKYALNLFLPGCEKYDILPGTNANSVVKNVQFMNAFGIEYVAIWDNDEEGRKEYNRATTAYGPGESKRFLLLPGNNKNKFRMEEMFTDDDHQMLRTITNSEPNSTYESLLTILFHGDAKTQAQAREKSSIYSKEKFAALKSSIESTLSKAKISI